MLRAPPPPSPTPSPAVAQHGCAAVHLRHIEKTGGSSMHAFLHRLGFEHQPVPIRAARRYDLLIKNRSYFSEQQAGRRIFMHYHSPQEWHGPYFLRSFQPRLQALRQVYAERNCTFLVMTIMRDPVAHLVSHYFHFEPVRRAEANRFQLTTNAVNASRNANDDRRSLVQDARRHAEMQLYHLACARDCITQQFLTSNNGTPTRRKPLARAVSDVLPSFDLIGVTEELAALQVALCRRLAFEGPCPKSVAINQAPPRKALSNGLENSSLSVSDAKAQTAPGRPLHSQLLATSPLTACVHRVMLNAWRAELGARQDGVGIAIPANELSTCVTNFHAALPDVT